MWLLFFVRCDSGVSSRVFAHTPECFRLVAQLLWIAFIWPLLCLERWLCLCEHTLVRASTHMLLSLPQHLATRRAFMTAQRRSLRVKHCTQAIRCVLLVYRLIVISFICLSLLSFLLLLSESMLVQDLVVFLTGCLLPQAVRVCIWPFLLRSLLHEEHWEVCVCYLFWDFSLGVYLLV